MRGGLAMLGVPALLLALAGGPAGAADDAACPSVIDTLDRLAQMLPAIGGQGNALVATMLLPVGNSALRAKADAASAVWSESTLTALQEIADTSRGIVQRTLPVGAETRATMQSLGAAVAAEAQVVCAAMAIPMAAAG